MRIALDFDGTIADAVGAKVRYARERYAVTLPPEDSMRPGAVPLMGLEAYEQMIRDVFGSPLTLEMEPMPGAVQALHRLQRDHELYVVTARLDEEVDYAGTWLHDRGIEVQDIHHTRRGPKVAPCEALEAAVLLEDSATELTYFGTHAACMALLETPYNRELERLDHWRLVPDWPAFEVLCEELARTEVAP
ncbi:MAG: hypothetical protein GEU80_03085 [Dehalococcoidia bacterium]|nr:hypothetical protein [Dehalococcoidia bacterium]